MTIIHPDDRDEFPWTAHVAGLEQQRDQAIAERDDALLRLAEARTKLLSTASYLETGMDLDVSPQVFVVFDQLADSLRRAADPIAPASAPEGGAT